MIDLTMDAIHEVVFAAIRRAVTHAIKQEREACARLVENHGHSNGRIRASHKHLAQAIRHRGATSGDAA